MGLPLARFLPISRLDSHPLRPFCCVCLNDNLKLDQAYHRLRIISSDTDLQQVFHSLGSWARGRLLTPGT